LARKSNTKPVMMDKGSFFFASKCGACHPGDASLKYDRDGQTYWNGTQFGYQALGKTAADVNTYGTNIDGDYTIVNAAGNAVAARWDLTGVAEGDCLMCHLPGYDWSKRAAVLGGGVVTPTVGGAFSTAATAGLGFADVNLCVQGADACFTAFPPTAKGVAVNYAAATAVKPDGTTAITPTTVGQFIQKSPADGNCRGCHATPDQRKSGRSWEADTDVHKAANVGCTQCHPAGLSSFSELTLGREVHEIGKGDITIGSARDDVDNTGYACVDCHVLGFGPPGAPDPTLAHATFPPLHFEKFACQVCHVRHLDDSAITPKAETPDIFIDMATAGKQIIFNASQYLKTDPVDPAQHDPAILALAGCTDPANVPGSCSTPRYTYRWYPGVRPWKGKITTVKPLLTSWVGDWLDGFGLTARVKPLPLRLARKAIRVNAAGSPADAAGVFVNPVIEAARLANPTAFDIRQDATANGGVAGLLNTEAEIEAYLRGMRGAVETNTGNPAGDPIFVGTPVVVRAGKVWYINALDRLAFFESPVAESHDFAVNHNVVPKRDPADPVAKPGPWGATGCGECHSPGSAFFYAKQLADPQATDGARRYHEHWEAMGYSPQYVATLTAGVPSVGPSGPTGATGSTGGTGDPGATGATGATGGTGDPGATGATGATGVGGATGSTGSPGTPGPQGPEGSSGCSTGLDGGALAFLGLALAALRRRRMA
jgi:MYXO-CTERM domain-containing protein